MPDISVLRQPRGVDEQSVHEKYLQTTKNAQTALITYFRPRNNVAEHKKTCIRRGTLDE
jgi:hypothetical protein